MPFILPEPFSSGRLTLRLVRECDLPDLQAINGDDAVTRYLPYSSWSGPADGQAWLARMQGLMERGDTLQFVIVERRSQQVIGSCLLFQLDATSGRAEIGYVMGRAWWRQGFSAEAVRLLVAHSFAPRPEAQVDPDRGAGGAAASARRDASKARPQGQGLRRLEAQVNPDNLASNALLLKIGFQREGCLRQRWISKGVAVDTHFYGLLRQEWSASETADPD